MGELHRQVNFSLGIHFQDYILTAQREDGPTIWQSVGRWMGAWRLIGVVLFYLEFKRDLLVADNSAERLILDIGAALPLDQELIWVVRGRNLKSGLPEALEMSSVELYETMKNEIHRLVSEVSARLTPDPNLEWAVARDAELRGGEMLPILIPKPLKPALRESSVTLTGGFASRIKKLDELLTKEVGVLFVIGDTLDEPLNHSFFAPDLLEFDE